MLKHLLTAAAISVASIASAVATAEAQTVKVLILQNDEDELSLQSNNRIQRAVLNVFQQNLHAPAVLSEFGKYGIQGADVYDESIFLDVFSRDPNKRRNKAQLIRTAELAANPVIDVIVLYTLYARAVEDPYIKVPKLLMSLNYEVLDVKSKRYFGGDNLDLTRTGSPLTGCATHLNGTPPDAYCVQELVSTHGERLARDAGNAIALRLAALIGPHYSAAHTGQSGYSDTAGKSDELGGGAATGGHASANGAISADGTIGGDVVNAVTPGHEACPNIPTTFIVTFEGFTPSQMTFLEGNLAQWKCALDLDAVGQSLANASYEYKTKANAAQAMRSIRFILDYMGVHAEIKPQSGNEVLVRAFGLRSN
ncbi:MAG: hypothetical protein GC150_11375 [Rhizobiales bacterium]|nr:hypothetical protein [Hyphomicrobiales bacterium]